MIKTVEIKNFRCFENLDIDDLRTVNVVVGANGSGKTSLLESLFLALCGGPDIPMRLRLWRGLGSTLNLSATRVAYEGIWEDLFRNFDNKEIIEVKTSGHPENSRHLKVWYLTCVGTDGWQESQLWKLRLRCLLAASCSGDPNTGLEYAWSSEKNRPPNLIPLNHSCFDQVTDYLKNLS